MALPNSGTMTLAMIAGEFGGSTPHAISEYYRGGGLVPNNPANSGIPTSGTISFSHFYGGIAQFMGSYSGSVTTVNGLDGNGDGYVYGTAPFSPTTDSNGKSLIQIYELYMGYVHQMTGLEINGFSSSPGVGYFTNCYFSGNLRTSATSSYGYASGDAVWEWYGYGATLFGGSATLVYS